MSKPHENQCWDYDFTLNRVGDLPLPDLSTFVSHIRPLFKKWTFQIEACPTTGRHHYQGRGSLFKKKRHPELVKLLKDTPIPTLTVSETTNNSRSQESFYTLKYDSKVDGPWSDTTWREPEYIPRQYRGLLDRLYPWQQTVLDSRHDFDCRAINLIYDPIGNNGKSTVASLGALHYGGYDLPPIGDHKELTQILCDQLMAKGDREPSFVFVDLPRALTMDARRFAPFMIAIEQIKKGHVDDPRHHYKHWWYDSPAVWVFCNHLPDVLHMSADRWKFHCIDRFFKNLVPKSRDEIIAMSQQNEPNEPMF